MGSLTSIVFGAVSILLVTGCKSELAMPSGGAAEISQSSSTLNPVTPAASAAHILSGKKAYDSDGNVITGSMANLGAIDLSQTPAASGYYSSTSNAPTNSQICATETILGVTGNRICQDTAMTAVSSNQILSGNTFYDSTGSKRSGSLTTSSGSATAITSDENNDAVTQISVTPGVNELFSSVLVDLGAHFKKENICSGKTIFGRLGTAGCSLAFGSRGHRTPGSATERAIPVVATDDDGMGDVTRPDTSTITTCGNTQATVAARIADCGTSWDGEALGKMGEGKWSLVTKANGYEVWKDERTGMLWSDNLGSFNWCQASGNTEIDGGIDCSAGNGLQPDPPAVSVCAESTGLNSDGYNDPKGGMRKTATETSPSVSWRLPTRNDYLQAYANGMGYVLPGFADGWRNYWTASVYSGSRIGAWAFAVYSGGDVYLSFNGRDNNAPVRCVGR